MPRSWVAGIVTVGIVLTLLPSNVGARDRVGIVAEVEDVPRRNGVVAHGLPRRDLAGGLPRDVAWVTVQEDSPHSPLLAADVSDGGVESATHTVVEETEDLDGDDVDDVLFLEAASDGTAVWRVLSGVDGRLLWSLDQTSDRPTFLKPSGFDADGDGGTDLLSVDYGDTTYDSTQGGPTECDDNVSCQSFHTSRTWSVGVRAGRTGELLWARDNEARSTSVMTTTSATVFDRHTISIDELAQPRGVATLVGVTGHQVMITSASREYSYEYEEKGLDVAEVEQRRERRSTSSTLDVQLLDPATGFIELERTYGPVHGAPVVEGIGDIDGDGTDDIAVHDWGSDDYNRTCMVALGTPLQCEGDPEDVTDSFALVSGTTLRVLWRRELPAQSALVYPIGADLDGDGGEEVLHRSVTAGGEPRSAMLRSFDGREMWSVQGDGAMPVIGDIDDDGVADLLQFNANANANADGLALDLLRRSGRTGEGIASTSYGVPSGGYAQVFDDSDGDGVRDVVVGAWTRREDGGYAHSRGSVESGRTGERRYDLHFDGAAVLWDVGADVNADGVGDFDWSTVSSSGSTTLRVLDGQGEGVLLEMQAPSALQRGMGDIDGVAGDDILVTSEGPTGRREGTMLSARSGRNAQELWHRRSTFVQRP